MLYADSPSSILNTFQELKIILPTQIVARLPENSSLSMVSITHPDYLNTVG